MNHLTPISKNVKTGLIPVSTTTAASCPKACPFNHSNIGGCYAEQGHVGMHWRKVTSGERGDDYETFCNKINALPKGTFWRHNQAGDLHHNDEVIDYDKLMSLAAANSGKRGFTYTHHDMTNEKNQIAVYMANQMGFVVNLSGNNPQHADTLADLNIAPVVTVLTEEYQRKHKGAEWLESMEAYKARLESLPMETPAGRKLVVCPATNRDDVSCSTCQLCQREGRQDVVVGFPAHGSTKKKASLIAAG